MAPQKQQGIYVTTFDADKAKGFNNLELRDSDVPQPKDSQVRRIASLDADLPQSSASPLPY